jgi:hypothetical protein
MGLSWDDIEKIPCDIAEHLLQLQKEIDEWEEKEMKKFRRI